MVALRGKRILVDGTAVLVLCGELHYFRLDRGTWKHRVRLLASAGCNAVASYVPWIVHETCEGAVDLNGARKPENDLGAFIDLCAEAGLWFFVRPGPFVMAEMKNEGIPYWVYTKHPGAVPVGWDGKPATTRTLDYLHPGFLAEARSWYAAVDAVVAPRTQPRGGNVIAYQLDNEIGMLSWVSNTPDLSDGVLADFTAWLEQRYGASGARERYPFLGEGAEAFRDGVRTPREPYAARLMQDLGRFQRSRYARYASTLAAWAVEDGVEGIPFVVNIHGTGGGRGFTFPVGISQLLACWREEPGRMSGTDIYLGNLTMDTFQDLHVINAFTDAANGPDQPLAAVEFECGDGNYGETLGGRYDPSAVDLKARMCVAQGARLLNYYLFAGGRNALLDPPPGDGNNRFAITGERHGFAAPVSPEGALNYTWPRMTRSLAALRAAAGSLAVMEEERDAIGLGFIPDYWMTESRHPASRTMQEVCAALEEGRGFGAWEIMVRALLLAGYRFGARDIQNLPLDPGSMPVLALGTARYMDRGLQRKLAAFAAAGGGLLLYGELPTRDMEGEPCADLALALASEPDRVIREADLPCLSLSAHGWAAPRAELRTGRAQVFRRVGGEVLLRVASTAEPCAFDAPVGKGRAVVIAAGYRCDVALFREAAGRLGAVPALAHDCPHGGIFMTSAAAPGVGRFVHVVNLDGFEKRVRITLDGRRLFGGRALRLAAREGLMLPLGVSFAGTRVASSTAEVVGASRVSLRLRLTQPRDVVALDTDRTVIASPDYEVKRAGRLQVVTSRKDARVDDDLTVRLEAAPAGVRARPASAPASRGSASRRRRRGRGAPPHSP